MTISFPLQSFLVRSGELLDLLIFATKGFAESAPPDTSRMKRVFAEVLHIRAVDLYLVYLAELLALIYQTRPEMLRSSEALTTSEVLAYPDRDALVSAPVERKVLKLTTLSMSDLADTIERDSGFALFSSPEQRFLIVKQVEIRNLLVHSHGVVNRHFQRRVPSCPVPVGQPLVLGIPSIQPDLDALIVSARSIDSLAAAKWQLPVEHSWPTATPPSTAA
jgi:hypothetical protein